MNHDLAFLSVLASAKARSITLVSRKGKGVPMEAHAKSFCHFLPLGFRPGEMVSNRP